MENHPIEQHLALVRRIARQYPISSVSQEDLIQEGCFGLMEALKQYDHSRGIRFESYAAWWIRKYILEAIRQYGYIISQPQHIIPEHIYTEQLDAVVGSDEGEQLTYEDVLRSSELQPDEEMVFQEGLNEWNRLKKRQKKQKKRIDVGKFKQKYVNK